MKGFFWSVWIVDRCLNHLFQLMTGAVLWVYEHSICKCRSSHLWWSVFIRHHSHKQPKISFGCQQSELCLATICCCQSGCTDKSSGTILQLTGSSYSSGCTFTATIFISDSTSSDSKSTRGSSSSDSRGAWYDSELSAAVVCSVYSLIVWISMRIGVWVLSKLLDRCEVTKSSGKSSEGASHSTLLCDLYRAWLARRHLRSSPWSGNPHLSGLWTVGPVEGLEAHLRWDEAGQQSLGLGVVGEAPRGGVQTFSREVRESSGCPRIYSRRRARTGSVREEKVAYISSPSWSTL